MVIWQEALVLRPGCMLVGLRLASRADSPLAFPCSGLLGDCGVPSMVVLSPARVGPAGPVALAAHLVGPYHPTLFSCGMGSHLSLRGRRLTQKLITVGKPL